MSIRVIAGQYGDRTLATPPGNRTHPMSERARNALFNSLGDEVKGARVLDAFAGTGALGIEALSRGAQQATFVERDRIAQSVIAKNIASLGIDSAHARLQRAPLASWIEHLDASEKFDLILADPPYHDVQFSTVAKLFGLLKPGALMVLSHPGRGEVPIRYDIVVVDSRSYSNAYLTFFRREG
ncbi:16S rRNA (guanine(966)-N(2))-methyltransferase RsmD [Candidatus Saccharibacteria bacterium]|nr:MAG: 16S rRNA (guanine(966)-N(2))-methyltransferase RsmD [Candidatus Saccharibacteria bacterium]